MKIPKGYRGIFFGPQNGAMQLFESIDMFLEDIPQDSGAAFFIAGAYVDLVINDYQSMAQNLVLKAQKIWPDLPWEDYMSFLQEFIHKLQNEEFSETLPEELWNEYENKFLAEDKKLPADFKCWFLGRESYSVAFAQPYGIVQMHIDYSKMKELFLILIGLKLNGYNKLHDTILKEVRMHAFSLESLELLEKYALEYRNDPNLESVVPSMLQDPVQFRITNAKLN